MDDTPLVVVLASLIAACSCTSTSALDNTGQSIGTCDCPWTQDDFRRLTAEVASLRTDVEAMKERMPASNVQGDQSNAVPEPDNVEGYIYATCKPMPNSALTTELFQPITGVINLKQNISGGPLMIDVFMYGFRSPAGSLHGFHIHTYGDLIKGCQSTGGHYNPYKMNHGGPNDTERHVGDLGNISPNGSGVVNTVIEDSVASLIGNHSIIGRAFVIHAGEDDLGRGGFSDSHTTGHAGQRLACCVIGISEK